MGVWIEYKEQARRTQRKDLRKEKRLIHAITGAISEREEIEQEYRNGDRDALLKECGDLCWFIAEYTDCVDIVLRDCELDTIIGLYRRSGETDDNLYAEFSKLFRGVFEPVQKSLQGHSINREALRENIERLIAYMTFITGGNSIASTKVMLDMNILKLKNRYPDGFDAERSVHRSE